MKRIFTALVEKYLKIKIEHLEKLKAQARSEQQKQKQLRINAKPIKTSHPSFISDIVPVLVGYYLDEEDGLFLKAEIFGYLVDELERIRVIKTSKGMTVFNEEYPKGSVEYREYLEKLGFREAEKCP